MPQTIQVIVPGVAGGEVSPGSGSTGFSSRTLVFGNASGQLTNNSSGPTWDSTLNFLGLGTTAPAQPLHINASTALAKFKDAAAGSTVTAYFGSGGNEADMSVNRNPKTGVVDSTVRDGWQLAMTASPTAGGKIEWYYLSSGAGAVSQWLHVNSSRQVGIGTTAPAGLLHVNGNVVLGGSTAHAVGFFGSTGSTQLAAITTNVPAAVYSSAVGAQLNLVTEVLRAFGFTK